MGRKRKSETVIDKNSSPNKINQGKSGKTVLKNKDKTNKGKKEKIPMLQQELKADRVDESSKISEKPSQEAVSHHPFTDQQLYHPLTHLDNQVPPSNGSDSEDQQKLQSKQAEQMKIAQTLHAYKEQLQPEGQEQTSREGSKEVSEVSGYQDPSSNHDPYPTLQQIQAIFQLFSERFTERNIQKMIIKLYNCIILKNKQGKDIQYTQPPIKQPALEAAIRNLQDELAKLGTIRPSITKRYIRNPHQSACFAKEEDQLKFNEKKMVARAFCSRDYGISALQQQIAESGSKISIERSRYKTLASTVVTDAYRKLQQFLIKQCRRRIKPLNREQIRCIFTALLNCRSNFQSQDCLTFFKFMKIVYGIGSVTITEQSAIKFYINIQKVLKTRMGELQLQRLHDTMRCNKQFKARRSFQSDPFMLHKIWNNQLEEEMLELYKRNQQLMKIRDYFKHKYPQHQHLFTIDSLRSRLHKVLRVALRKVNCFCQKFTQERIPGLIKLNDLKVKFILRSPDAINARLLLVDMYLRDECDIKRLFHTVSAVNEFVIMKDQQRVSQIIEAEPLIHSAAQKVQHNVAVSKFRQGGKRRNDLYLKGQEENFNHFVQVQNGHSLHYYKITQDRPQKDRLGEGEGEGEGQGEGDEIKWQDVMAIDVSQGNDEKYEMSKDITKEQVPIHKSATDDGGSNRTAFQNIIRQQLLKYMQPGKCDTLSICSQ